MDVPRIISVDDHVLEPPDLWQRWLPARFRDEGPRLVRSKGRIAGRGRWQETDDGGWADVWHYQGFEMAIIPGFAAAGKDQNWLGAHWDPMIYDDMLPGCYEQSAATGRHGSQPHRGIAVVPDVSRGSAGRRSSSTAPASSAWPAFRPTTTG